MKASRSDLAILAEHLSDDEIIQLLKGTSGFKDLIRPYLGLSTYPDNPVTFSKEILGWELWKKQVDIVNSVINNRYTVVEAGKGVGKSLVSAAIACYWMAREDFEQTKVVIIAPTSSHVNNVLWAYIRQAGMRSNLPGRILKTARWEINPDRFAVGLSGEQKTKEDSAKLQGYHSPNLLVILDEAAGLNRDIWEAVQGLATSERNKILAIGNPIGQSGPFWDACVSPIWNRINISCLEAPNVIKREEVIPGLTSYDWVRERILEHCIPCEPSEMGSFEWDGVWYMPDAYFQAEVLGVAPYEAEDQLISIVWVRECQAITVPEPKGEIELALDPSRGGDQACLIAKQGNKVLWIKRRKPTSNNPSGELAGWVKSEMNDIGAIRCYIDNIGIGAGVVDAARAIGVPVIGINSSRSPSQKNRFINLRIEMYWRLREALQKGLIDIPDDSLLEGDLLAQKYSWDNQGRFVLESKEKVINRLNRSPDTSDALALFFSIGGLSNEDAGVAMRAKLNSLSESGGSRWLTGDVRGKKSTASSRWRVSGLSRPRLR